MDCTGNISRYGIRVVDKGYSETVQCGFRLKSEISVYCSHLRFELNLVWQIVERMQNYLILPLCSLVH